MTRYRYVVTEITSGDTVADLPLSGVGFESFVSGAGKLGANLRFPSVGDDHGKALARIYRSALDPVRCALHVLRDGVPVWGGPVWSTGYDMASKTAKIEAAEWYSFLKKRYVTTEESFTSDDLHDIARALVTYTQADGDLGIQLDATLSGETLSITYTATEVAQVAKAIETLGAQANGFEFAIDLTLDGGDLVRTLNLSHPTRGRVVDTSKIVFEYSKNLVNWTEQFDGTQMAGEVIGIGAGQGDEALMSIKNPTVPVIGYPLVQSVASFKDVTDQGVLDLLTQAEADRTRLPVRTVNARVLPDDLGSYRTGDEARFIIEPNRDPWNIDGLDETNRIIGIKVSPDDDGGRDVVDLTLVNRPVTDQTVEAAIDARLKALETTPAA